jgi:hypothetical protein
MMDFSKEEYEEIEVKQYCSSNQKHPVRFHATIALNLNEKNIDFQLDMRCNYDKCNNIDIIGPLREVTDKYYSIQSMLKILGYKTNSKLEKTTMLTTSGTTTPKNNGQYVQGTKAMIYAALFTFMTCWIFLI